MTELLAHDLQWIVNRLPSAVVLAMKERPAKLILAGGFIRSCVAKEEVRDVDLFVPSIEAAQSLAFELSLDPLGRHPKARAINTENAITILGLRHTVQIITRWTFDRPEDVLPSFDFTIAKAAVWYQETAGNPKKWHSLIDERFYADLAGKRLVYTCPQRNEDAGGSMLRLLKFYSRGYTAPLSTVGDVMARMLNGVEKESTLFWSGKTKMPPSLRPTPRLKPIVGKSSAGCSAKWTRMWTRITSRTFLTLSNFQHQLINHPKSNPMIQRKWNNEGAHLRAVSIDFDNLPGDLPKGVYRLEYDDRGPRLAAVARRFPLPKKMYAIRSEFIARVQKTWHAIDRNLGVLFNGIRGTGKTATAMKICNDLDLPVIIVGETDDNIGNFVAMFNQEAVFMFDEFDKWFPNQKSQILLSVMDGASSGEWRKLFMLTTNEQYLDPNFLQRPGRIRYVMKFDNLDEASIREIVADRLTNKRHAEGVVNFIASLDIITIDIVMAIADEVNIHDQLPAEFFHCFNVKKSALLWDVFEVCELHDFPPVIATAVRLNISRFLEDYNVGDLLYANKTLIGRITEVLSEHSAVIQTYQDNDEDLPPVSLRTISISEAEAIHPVFSKKKPAPKSIHLPSPNAMPAEPLNAAIW